MHVCTLHTHRIWRFASPFFYNGGGRAKRPSHTSQRSAAPAVAAKMVAGAMAATGRPHPSASSVHDLPAERYRGRGRVVTQRCFGPTRSLAAPSAATFKVAASGAAHERLSPTSGRAGRVVRMGQERGVRGGQGRRGEPRRRCEVAGRAQAGGANTSCVQGHCARARVGGARTFRLDLGLLAR